ncbi:PaaX family transcriptional regulator C-terminal domain-containing protein [Nonomuraea sp. G32]|nr:PaaX family transcriptional regulator C-terminal domain-containing protein [Nonomuraea sp. G32]MDP4511629.1 PaaX family transcriptional regulator C-terminal domain-containing protein [Nonomuraea sp. G32]
MELVFDGIDPVGIVELNGHVLGHTANMHRSYRFDVREVLREWRHMLLADPGLPPTLLPDEWSGERARRRLLDLYAAWSRPAQTWWWTREDEASET